jgi:hypothetical protein
VGQSFPSSDFTRASFSSERPARPMLTPSGACRARYSAVSFPTKPVAPKTTTSRSRLASMDEDATWLDSGEPSHTGGIP